MKQSIDWMMLTSGVGEYSLLIQEASPVTCGIVSATASLVESEAQMEFATAWSPMPLAWRISGVILMQA